MIDAPDTYFAEVIIKGRVHKLETSDDLNLYRSMITSGFEWTIFETPEDQQKIIDLVSAYEQAGSPPLKAIDHVQERIHDMINMHVWIGDAYVRTRNDHPGSRGVEPWCKKYITTRIQYVHNPVSLRSGGRRVER